MDYEHDSGKEFNGQEPEVAEEELDGDGLEEAEESAGEPESIGTYANLAALEYMDPYNESEEFN